MLAITTLLDSLFGSSFNTTDAEMQQRISILEQSSAKQKVTNLILYGLDFVFSAVRIFIAVKKK